MAIYEQGCRNLEVVNRHERHGHVMGPRRSLGPRSCWTDPRLSLHVLTVWMSEISLHPWVESFLSAKPGGRTWVPRSHLVLTFWKVCYLPWWPPLHETRSLGSRNGPVMLLDAFAANFFGKFIWVWSWEQRAWLQWFLCVEITNVKGGLTGHTVGSDSSWPQMTRCHQFCGHIKHEKWTIQRNLDPRMGSLDKGFLYLACGEVSSPRLRM